MRKKLYRFSNCDGILLISYFTRRVYHASNTKYWDLIHFKRATQYSYEVNNFTRISSQS